MGKKEIRVLYWIESYGFELAQGQSQYNYNRQKSFLFAIKNLLF